MRKIPTLFERDWDGTPSLVTRDVVPGCEWVLAGEGVATVKLDGACCLVRDGRLYSRREVKPGGQEPAGFEEVARDAATGERVGWVPVDAEAPADKWHREALASRPRWPNGTYELVGPKVQGNPEGYPDHVLVAHGSVPAVGAPRDFDGLREWLAANPVEGVVWHHPDGRMAKVKARDFGIRRRKLAPLAT